MPIPRPENLKPPQFKDRNWVKQGETDEGFHKTPLSVTEFMNTGFERFFGIPHGTWEFLWRPPRIEDDETEDLEWKPVRFLGAGGFGSVGLWRKIREGGVIDEMAIKEASRPDPEHVDEVLDPITEAVEGLCTEAALNNDLNKQDDSEHISFLRNFKYFPHAGEHGTYRFFCDYCPFDSLYTVATKYKMWDEWLPELFLWHVFIQLLKGIQILEKPPPPHTVVYVPGTEKTWRTCFVIHLDLKPDNVLLDYGTTKDGPSEEARYPDIRIADFGNSQYTCMKDFTNPDLIDCGTDGYKPPEQTHRQTQWGATFKRPPVKPGVPWDKAHNLWVVGKIMFDIMTHQTAHGVDFFMEQTDEKLYKKNDEHFLPIDWEKLWPDLVHKLQDDLGKLAATAPGQAASDPASEEQQQAEEDDLSAQPELEQLPNDTAAPEFGSAGAQDNAEEQRKKAEAHHQAKVDNVLAHQRLYQALTDHWRYSEALKLLVRDLLAPRPADRPHSKFALTRAMEGREAYVNKFKTPVDEMEPRNKRKVKAGLTGKTLIEIPENLDAISKLYYRGNDINKMLVGKGDYIPDLDRYQRMVTKCDPDEPMLLPPQEKWKEYIKPLGPTAPRVEIYDGTRRIESPRVLLRDPTEQENPPVRSDLPTADDYGQRNDVQLSEDLARRNMAPHVVKHAKDLRDGNSRDQLIEWLMHLDQGGRRGRDPTGPATSVSLAAGTLSVKRPSEDLDGDEESDPVRPKKRSKGKRKREQTASDQIEQDDMYGTGVMPAVETRPVNEHDVVEASEAPGKKSKSAQNQQDVSGSEPEGVINADGNNDVDARQATGVPPVKRRSKRLEAKAKEAPVKEVEDGRGAAQNKSAAAGARGKAKGRRKGKKTTPAAGAEQDDDDSVAAVVPKGRRKAAKRA